MNFCSNLRRIILLCGFGATVAGLARAAAAEPPVIVQPTDRVLVQRGFVPFAGRKRLYACAVGTPAGIHFAYDLATGAILYVWRGSFLDTTEMWQGRAFNQTEKPVGTALALGGKPLLAMFPEGSPLSRKLLEEPKTGAWPDDAETLYSSLGYDLEPNGLPVFRATLSELAVQDRIAPEANGLGLTRSLTFSGPMPYWETWVLIAEADKIVPIPGSGFAIGNGEWWVGWPAASALQPTILTFGSQQRLVVHLPRKSLAQPLVYSIEWTSSP